MSSILFVTWDGGGNVPPAVGIARELVRRGHQVKFLGHPSQQDHFADQSLAFAPFAACVPFSAVEGAGPGKMTKVFGDRAMGMSVVTEAKRISPDLVVVDCLMFGVMDELRKAGLPYAVLEHSLDGYYRQAAKSPLGFVMRLKGFRVLDLIDGGRATICTSIEELDTAGGHPIHTGAVVTGVPARPTTPTILVSLSTFGFPSLAKRWADVLAAVDGLDARVIATVGTAIDPQSLKLPGNVEVHGYVPHTDLLPHVSAVLGHGGHGTTLAALAHGVPIVVVPVNTQSGPAVHRQGRESGRGWAGSTPHARSHPHRARTGPDRSPDPCQRLRVGRADPLGCSCATSPPGIRVPWAVRTHLSNCSSTDDAS